MFLLSLITRELPLVPYSDMTGRTKFSDFLLTLGYTEAWFAIAISLLMCSFCITVTINLIYKVINLSFMSLVTIFLWILTVGNNIVFMAYILAFVSAVVMLFLGVVMMLPFSLIASNVQSNLVLFLPLLIAAKMFAWLFHSLHGIVPVLWVGCILEVLGSLCGLVYLTWAVYRDITHNATFRGWLRALRIHWQLRLRNERLSVHGPNIGRLLVSIHEPYFNLLRNAEEDTYLYPRLQKIAQRALDKGLFSDYDALCARQIPANGRYEILFESVLNDLTARPPVEYTDISKKIAIIWLIRLDTWATIILRNLEAWFDQPLRFRKAVTIYKASNKSAEYDPDFLQKNLWKSRYRVLELSFFHLRTHDPEFAKLEKVFVTTAYPYLSTTPSAQRVLYSRLFNYGPAWQAWYKIELAVLGTLILYCWKSLMPIIHNGRYTLMHLLDTLAQASLALGVFTATLVFPFSINTNQTTVEFQNTPYFIINTEAEGLLAVKQQLYETNPLLLYVSIIVLLVALIGAAVLVRQTSNRKL